MNVLSYEDAEHYVEKDLHKHSVKLYRKEALHMESNGYYLVLDGYVDVYLGHQQKEPGRSAEQEAYIVAF